MSRCLCPCSCLRRRADLPDPHGPDQHHCSRSGHGVLACAAHPAGRGGCAQEGSASDEEQARTFPALPLPRQLCTGLQCRVLIFLSHAMKCFMKNLPLFKNAKQKCTSTNAVCWTVKPWVKCKNSFCEVCEFGCCSKEKSTWWDTCMTADIFLQTLGWVAFFELLHSCGLLHWILSLSLAAGPRVLLVSTFSIVSLVLLAALGFLLQGLKGSSKG